MSCFERDLLIPKPEILNYQDPDDKNRTVLHKAIYRKYGKRFTFAETIVEKLCQIDDIDVLCKDSENYTPLDLALEDWQLNIYEEYKAQHKIVQSLILKISNIGEKITEKQLQKWAERGFYLSEKILPLDEKTLNSKNSYGNTALHLAALNNWERTTLTLIASGVNPFLLNNKLDRPGNQDTYKTLLRYLAAYRQSLIDLHVENQKNQLSSVYKNIDLSKPDTWPTCNISTLIEDITWKKQCSQCKKERGDYIMCHDKPFCSGCVKIEKPFFPRISRINCPDCTKRSYDKYDSYICPACMEHVNIAWCCEKKACCPLSRDFLPIACTLCNFPWQLYEDTEKCTFNNFT